MRRHVEREDSEADTERQEELEVGLVQIHHVTHLLTTDWSRYIM